MDLKEVALSGVVALIVGVAFAVVTFFALYSTMGYFGLGVAIVFGFPSGIILGIWLRFLAAGKSK